LLLILSCNDGVSPDDAIPTGLSNSEWENTTVGAYAEYPADDDSQSEATCNGDCSEVYGLL